MTSKPCTQCNETKTLDEFSNSRRAKDGKQTWCRTCSSAWARENGPALRRPLAFRNLVTNKELCPSVKFIKQPPQKDILIWQATCKCHDNQEIILSKAFHNAATINYTEN